VGLKSRLEGGINKAKTGIPASYQGKCRMGKAGRLVLVGERARTEEKCIQLWGKRGGKTDFWGGFFVFLCCVFFFCVVCLFFFVFCEFFVVFLVCFVFGCIWLFFVVILFGGWVSFFWVFCVFFMCVFFVICFGVFYRGLWFLGFFCLVWVFCVVFVF